MRIHLSSKSLLVVAASVVCALLAGVVFVGSAAATPQPSVSSVGVPTAGSYAAGQNLDFTVNWSQPVTVDTTGGTPYVLVTIGSTPVHAAYVSGTGTSALVFRYTVQAGDNDTDGVAVGAAITLNGGTIVDQSDGLTAADPTLNSVGSTSAVDVDTTAPVVSSVGVPSAGSYAAGQNLDFTVDWSEPVVVNTGGGTPRVALTVGSSPVFASYLSGSGTTALTFRYTVQAGDNDTDGIAVGALGANGGTIRDAAGNDATLTLNSVGSTSSVNVDTTAPTVSSVAVPPALLYHLGQQLSFTVNFTENVTVVTTGGTPSLPLTVGSTLRSAAYASGSGTSALVFHYTVQAGDLDSDGVALGSAAQVNGGTIRDAAGNNATLTLNSVGSTTGVTVDAVAPTISSVTAPNDGSYSVGAHLDFTVHFSENVTVSTGGGIPSIPLTIGTATQNAAYVSGSGTKDVLFRYTVAASDSDTDGITVASAIALNGGTITDAASNASALSLPSGTASILVDTTAPAVSSVTAPASKTYKTGDNVDFQLAFSEKVVVSGAPRLTLTVGKQTKYAAYLSGSGTATLTFRYTVAAGDSDTDGVGLSNAIDLNGGTLADAAGNAAPLSFTVPALAGVLLDGTSGGTTTPPPPTGGKDTTPPSKPAKASAKITKSGALYVDFGRSTDDTALAGYVVLANGKKVKTTSATSFLLPVQLAANTRSETVQVEALDKAGNVSAPVTITIARPAAPKGTPKLAPGWAVKLAAWQATPKRKRGKRPATPKHLPSWYGKWYAWQHKPLKVSVS